MKKFTKIAMPPDPMGMGAPMGDPMAMPMAGAAPPPPPAPPGPKVIKQPLSNLGLILADAEIEKMVMEEMQYDVTELSNHIWQMYGGDKEGGVDQNKVGKRVQDKEVDDSEIERTKNSRWERLPLDQTMEDLEITLEDMVNAVKFITFGLAKSKGKEQGAAGGGGGMPGLASRKLDTMVKIARNLDLLGLYSVADRIM
jgi:hypothetical protein